MNNIWVISDLFFGEDDALGRRPGTTKHLVRQWEQLVYPTDAVIVLGNVSRTQTAYWMGAIRRLPGQKLLIKGIHDVNRSRWYEQKGFDLVYDQMQAYWLPAEMIDGRGSLMLSSLPAFNGVVTSEIAQTHHNAIARLQKEYDYSESYLNLHGSTLGKGIERRCTIDVSPEASGFLLNKLEQWIGRYKDESNAPDRSSSRQ